MTAMNLNDLVQACQGQLLTTSQQQFSGVGTDSRKDLSGQIFFALRGDNFDAHRFLAQAVENRAAALVVDQDVDPTLKVSIVRVTDTLRALQDFAHFWRRQQRAKIIALTGSNGKTTTKQFLATLLREQFATQASEGSFNNHWGVPLTLLNLRAEHEMAVVEMGMNHAGELTRLCEIAEPDIVTVTMVGRAHIEHFGSVEKIAQAKSEIYAAAPPTATRVFNLDDPHTHQMYEQNHQPGRVLTYSARGPADVVLTLGVSAQAPMFLRIQGVIGGVAGHCEVPIFGEHNLVNLQAAAALALAAGARPENIWRGMPKCGSSWGRNQWLQLSNGARILFDGYNANPDSMRVLLDNVGKLQGRKLAVLGEMLELGEQSDTFHRELGERAAHAGFDLIYFVGSRGASFAAGLALGGFKKTFMKSETYEQNLATQLGSMLNPQDTVVVKGSRGIQLERVIAQWKPENFHLKK